MAARTELLKLKSDQIFEVPQIIQERYDQLCDLVQNHSEDGKLSALNLSRYLGRDIAWLRSAICNGCVPYAFGDGTKHRATSYIGILPFFMFETQALLLQLEQKKSA